MKRWVFSFIPVVVCLVSNCSVVRYADIDGGPSNATGDFQFSADCAFFRGSEDTVAVIFYITFPKASLTFVQEENGFAASYDGTIVVNTASGRRLISEEFEDRIEEPSYEVAYSSDDFEYKEFRVQLTPETYSITLTLQDRDSLRKGIVQRTLEVVPFPQDRISLSSIVFAEAVGRDSSGGFTIIPNSERIYHDRLPELNFYYEVYVPEVLLGVEDLRVQYEILSQQTGNSLILKESIPLEPREGKKAASGLIHLRGIDEEDAVLVIRVIDGEGETLAERRGNFHIHWSLVNWGDDFELSLAQLELVASTEVIAEYKKIEPEGREEFLKSYWKKRDPIPQTEQNELLLEFEKRLRYAQHHLGGMWTDRARVYIQNGPPQNVEKRIVRDTFGYPRSAEIWIYFDPYREFVFIEDRLIRH